MVEADIAILEAIHLDQLDVKIPSKVRAAVLMEEHTKLHREAVGGVLEHFYQASLVAACLNPLLLRRATLTQIHTSHRK